MVSKSSLPWRSWALHTMSTVPASWVLCLHDTRSSAFLQVGNTNLSSALDEEAAVHYVATLITQLAIPILFFISHYPCLETVVIGPMSLCNVFVFCCGFLVVLVVFVLSCVVWFFCWVLSVSFASWRPFGLCTGRSKTRSWNWCKSQTN